ncbi:MAG: branched-chain amino acid ABC transporter substrate-binding protein [Actinobacteria bacterium]|nr:branched-chain amino acid ABC transporter substrate-binding protein [Actinomycetota bacterium]
MRKRLSIAALIGVIGALALVAAGCGGSGGGGKTTTGETTTSSSGGATALPASSCPGGIYYEGSGTPEFIVASDLPLQGSGRTQTEQMVDAIKFQFKQHGFKAGSHTVGYQSCDDSTAQAGKWDSAKCSTNANAYARNKSVVGVIGTFNSGCAAIEIPIANRAPDGPLGMVSPANTYVGLTHKGPAIAPGEPDKYYPTGKRNYTRIVAADDFQGAADALLTQQLGYKSVFILNDKEAYGLGVAHDYEISAKTLKLTVSGFTAWDPKASSYEALATRIKQSGAETVFLGGLICENGAKLIKDLRSVLGAKYPLIAPDGFSDFTANGPAAADMYVSVAGIPPEKLTGPGKKFIDDFGAQIGTQVNPYAAYAAQAADVMLSAIEASDGTRASITDALFATDVTDGILGSFSINENGDTTANPVTVYIQQGSGKSGTGKTYKTIVPPASLVKAA